jgi:HAE1 family hydrophobic/amphiphilic exporter-1
MQKLAELCVKRPVFASVLVLILVVVGLFGFSQLGVDRFPKIDFPTVSVSTASPGSSPEAVETELTNPIEDSLNTISGIDEIRSTSAEGVSTVTITFVLEKDVNVAAQEVRDKINQVIPSLPDNVKQPVVHTFDPDAIPVITLAVTGNASLREITEYTDKVMRKQIEGGSGVGSMDIIGGRARQIDVDLDPYRMRSYGVTTNDVIKALQTQNAEIPGGQVEQGARQLTLRTLGRLKNVEDFNNIVLRTDEAGGAVLLSDVAQVLDTAAEQTSASEINGKPTLQVSILKQSGTNTLAVIDGIKARLNEIRKTLPPGYEVTVVRDESDYIKAAVHSVEEHLILGAILATLVVLAFLWNWRSTIIAAVAIPTSIIATFALMYFLGFTLNLITLLALTLAVGIVIDDAIVVLENIFRLMEEENLPPFQAAIEGTREIGFAVLATTLSLVAVFLPVAFMSGIVGRFMNSFGITMSAAILVSLLVSFSLTPMLSSRVLKRSADLEDIAEAEEESTLSDGSALSDGVRPAIAHHAESETSRERGFFRYIDHFYTTLLRWSMAHRWVIVLVCFLTLGATVPIAKQVPFNFLPSEDQSEATISFTAPEGTSLEATMAIARRMDEAARKMPGIEYTQVTAGGGSGSGGGGENQGSVYIKMKPLDQRTISQDELVLRLRREVMPQFQSEDLRSIVSGSSGFGGSGRAGATVQFVISGPDLKKLSQASQKALTEFKKIPGVVDADTSLNTGSPELEVQVDRQLAAQLGVQPTDVATALRYFVGGDEVTNLNQGGEQYEVHVRAQEQYREGPQGIGLLTVPSTKLGAVPLEQLVKFVPGTGPSEIEHYKGLAQVTLSSNLKPGVSQADVIARLTQIMKGLNLGPDYTFGPSGQAREQARTASSFMVALMMSLIFMYLILAAQFESWLHPITILLSLPLTVPFAMLSLLIFGQSINIFSMLGILVLFGIVKKNSILQIDHTNQLRARGLNRYDAIIQANRDRLRPILMTTLAFVAGMLPLIVSSGTGSGTNRAIGSVIFGGQSLSLLLTLLATPVAYSLFDDLTQWLDRTRVGVVGRLSGSKKRRAPEAVKAAARTD